MGIAEDVLADPGGRHVGQHVFGAGQLVKLGACFSPVDQGTVRVHHTLGVARGARGEKHRGHIGVGCFFNFFAKELGVLLGKYPACSDQLFERAQTVFGVLAQAAWIVVVNVGQLGALLAHFQHLVDLLLVFHHGKAHFGVGDGEHAFRSGGVLVQRHRNRAQRLRGQHGGVKTRAVGANHDQVLAALQARLVQTAGHGPDQAGQIRPAGGLPNAIFFLAQCGRCGALGSMLEHQTGKRCLHDLTCLQ